MPTVMVVDDTAVVRETVARILRLEGFEAVCAANGKEALNALDQVLPDVMLLDIMMPVMNGMQLLRILRSDPRWSKLPVIVTTALCDDESRTKAIELGATDFLVKARFTIAGMLETIKRQIAA